MLIFVGWLSLALAILALCEAPVAYGQSADNGMPPLYSSVKADGRTSDDAQLASDINACAAEGRTLQLPSGRILLTGANGETPTIRNCAIRGAGFAAGTKGDTASYGTTILLTNPTVPPFYIGNNWSIEGVNFFWPDQKIGTTRYPPLFSDNGQNTAHWYLDHVAIVNAYDGFTQGEKTSWGDFQISNASIYAMHAAFNLSSIGDMPHLSSIHFVPGVLIGICYECSAALNSATTENIIFHIAHSSLKSGSVQLQISNSDTFAWRYGFYLEKGATFSAGEVDMSWDGVGTLIDSSAGGNFSNNISGGGNCSIISFPSGTHTGNHPCFNLGDTGSLVLQNFSFASQGSGIVSAGSSVYMDSSTCARINFVNDGGDYSCIQITGLSSGTAIAARNSRFVGDNRSEHVHGISSGSNALPNFTLQNSEFMYFQDDVNVSLANPGRVSGNQSSHTRGSSSFVVRKTDTVYYWNNSWDKPPTATVKFGPGASVSGAFAGTIFVGSAVPTTIGALTLPFNNASVGGGSCQFTPSTLVQIAANYGGSPPTWVIRSSGELRGDRITFNCPGLQ